MAMTLEPPLQPEHCATLLLLPLCAPVVSGFLSFPAPGALGLGAVLVGCAVRLSALLVFVFPFVLFSFAKNPCRFSVPLKTF